MFKTKNMNKWLNYEFEPVECRIGKDFSAFARNFKAEILAQLEDTGCELASLNKGYFYISGFVYNKRNNRFMYFSTDDVRCFGNWQNNILVREAKNAKDFKGGRNQRTNLNNFESAVKAILHSGHSEFAA